MTDPFTLFDDWFTQAKQTELNDPDAMCLATVNAAGQPSTRMVLLKGHDPRGFVFYTNAHSQKAQDIAENAHVSLCFHWKSLRKQIRVLGACVAVSREEADAYFASRGRQSRLGAWASDQSAKLDTRETFLAKIATVTAEFEGKEVPRPPHWGGYRVVPTHIEFWEDREHRLHDRTVFTRETAENFWGASKKPFIGMSGEEENLSETQAYPSVRADSDTFSDAANRPRKEIFRDAPWQMHKLYP